MADTDEQVILQLLNERDTANQRRDAAAVLAPLDNHYVAYDFPPPLQSVGDGTRDTKALDAWFDTWEGPVTIELVQPTVLVDGDLAVVFGLGRLRGVKKDSGPMDHWNRRTIALCRVDGAWRIVHEHNSYPIKMDGTFRAATELKP